MITGIISEGRIRINLKWRLRKGRVFQAGGIACENVQSVRDHISF